MIMKRILLSCLILAAFLPAAAQEQVTYFLPATTVQVGVEAVKESFFAGPYAAYARKFLGIDVRQEDEVRTCLKSVTLDAATEADPAARFAAAPGKETDLLLTLSVHGLVCIGEDAAPEAVRWNFVAPERPDFSRKGVTSGQAKERRTSYRNVKSDSTDVFTQVPVYQDVLVTRTPEQRAKEAADLILKAQVNKIISRLREQKNICIRIEDFAYASLQEAATFDLSNGGRGIGNQVESLLINPLSRWLFDNGVSGDADIVIEGFNTTANPPSVICRREEAAEK